MTEILTALLGLLLCIGVPIGLIVAIVWAVNRANRRSQSSSGTHHIPVEGPLDAANQQAVLTRFERLVERWMQEGQLAPDVGTQVQALIQQERTAQAGLATNIAAPAAAPAATPPEQAPQPQQAPLPQPSGEAEIEAEGAAASPVPASSSALPETAPASPVPTSSTEAPPAAQDSAWGALLALRTRLTLLFAGAFLLLISALILVIYNWSSFPPALQFAMLAGVCGGFWAAGGWLARQPGLEQAGTGLQGVGGVLVPVVAFALGRLLDLPTEQGWLLASVLSLPVYVIVAWRRRHSLFVAAGCLAGISTALAATNLLVDREWFAVAVILILCTYLPLSHWLKRHNEPTLARVPVFVAHATILLTLLLSLAARGFDVMSDLALASTLWVSVGFYLLATWLHRHPYILWAPLALAPVALLSTLDALAIGREWWTLALAVLALVYLGVSIFYEPRIQPYTLPGYGVAALLTITSLLWLPGSLLFTGWIARWTGLFLLLVNGGAILAYHRGRFSWLREPLRLTIATAGMVLAGMLLPFWLQTWFDLASIEAAWQGLLLLLVPPLYMAGACWWPGRLRKSYDLSLQVLATLLALYAGGLTLLDRDAWLPGAVLLTAIWSFQAILRARSFWAALALGNALLVGGCLLDQLDLTGEPHNWIVLSLLFTVGYTIGATLLRQTAWRYWTWPGIGWGILVGLFTLTIIVRDGFTEPDGFDIITFEIWHIGEMSILIALCVVLTWLWRQALIGYPAAVIFALLVLIATIEGFFTTWQPDDADLAYVVCGFTLGLFLAGQGIRRFASPAYASPYEIVGFALLTLAPTVTAFGTAHATITWSSMLLLYGLATWRYKLAWVLVPTLLASDMALLNGAAWFFPTGDPAGAGRVLLVATWGQALLGLWFYRREKQPLTESRWRSHALAAYAVAVVSGTGALILASSNSAVLTVVALGLAVLLALIATLTQRSLVAWGGLLLLALGMGSLYDTLELGLRWSLGWGVVAALAVCLIGWGVDRLTQHATWRRPLLYAPLIAGGILTIAQALAVQLDDGLLPLTFTLLMASLLLATLAVRLRSVTYAYIAGGLLVGAGLCQLYDWGMRQPQWYVVPSGLYLLALAEGLRRIQGQRQVSQVVEAGALMIMLGTTLVQSLRADGLESTGYALALCIESLLILGYGTLRKLRVPFVGGGAFFVIGGLWLAYNPLMALNRWILIGLIGILLLGIYVLLERWQAQLTQAGRAWAERLQSWN